MDILKHIQELLDARKWSYYRLAKTMNKPTNTISDMFSRNTLPSLGTLEQICQAFDITLTQFFAADGEPVLLTEQQRKLIENFSTLEVHQKELVEAYINGLLELPMPTNKDLS